MVRIGVISDTHGLFDRVVLEHFAGLDHIIHAGDIGGRSVVEQLRLLAPVTAVSGNVDGYEQSGYPAEAVIELAGRRIAVRHILFEGGKLTNEGQAFLVHERPDVYIYGHTHQPKTEWYQQTLLFNPGSAGPKRFRLPRGLGILSLTPHCITPTLIPLGDQPA